MSKGVAVVGAGPLGLAVACRLRDVPVFDPAGGWLARWHEQMAAQEIGVLRSPAVHHPHPDPFALRRFAEGWPGGLVPPYDRPRTDLFAAFCREVARGLPVVPQKVVALRPGRRDWGLQLADGTVYRARRVVLATHAGRPRWPQWAIGVPGITHSTAVDLRRVGDLSGGVVGVVGGGLSAAHLVVGAAARGANVVWLVRRSLQIQEFDSDPGWLGPKYLKGFAAETDWQRRWEMVQQARGGGSITPALWRKIQRLGIEPWENTAVLAATATPTGLRLETERGEVLCDRLWLATGMEVTVDTEPLLQELRERYPTPIVGGWPVLDERLRWPGTEVFVMGALASLRLGPAARNLFGARLACDRLIPALTKPSLALAA
ncbi:MAG: FAD-dependent oxidoreductase [Pseudanabaenaceae cyanobacterium]